MSNPSGLKKIDVDGRHSVYEEASLDAAAYPGQMIVLAADGNYDPGAGVASAPMTNILLEDALQGNTIDTQYSSGDTAPYVTVNRGDRMLILCLSGEDLDVGELVKADSNGKFVATATAPAQFEILEDSGGALAADTHLLARAL